MSNIILSSDSYKVSHWKQYPPKTTNVYSYYESRGGQFDHTVFFGLQYILARHLSQPVTYRMIQEAEDLLGQHFGSQTLMNGSGWQHIVDKHRGYLPVRIKAVPEGTRVPTHNVLMTIENTDPEVPWLSNFLETLISQVWYPTTVATLSYETRKLIGSHLLKTSGSEDGLDFKLHDFGFRGASSLESASIGGAAHLINFLGTDTLPALTLLRGYYASTTAAGFSVPAAEHSTITSWGKEHEVDAYRNMVEQYGSFPFYSVVSDSYDLWAATRMWGTTLKQAVIEAEGSLVVRPDSGDPVELIPTLLYELGAYYGLDKNEQGYKVLNPKVRVIQGDGMEYDSIRRTLESMTQKGWSTENIVFGMGGGLLQKVNRDMQRFAIKTSSVVVDGQERDVWKRPTTDRTKDSKRGRLKLVRSKGDLVITVAEAKAGKDLLQTVFENGKLSNVQSLDEIRERVRANEKVPSLG